jgi:hypothetical protein
MKIIPPLRQTTGISECGYAGPFKSRTVRCIFRFVLTFLFGFAPFLITDGVAQGPGGPPGKGGPAAPPLVMVEQVAEEEVNPAPGIHRPN